MENQVKEHESKIIVANNPKIINLDSIKKNLRRKSVSLLVGMGTILLILAPELALFSFILDAAFLDMFIFLIGFQMRIYLNIMWTSILMTFRKCVRILLTLISKIKV